MFKIIIQNVKNNKYIFVDLTNTSITTLIIIHNIQNNQAENNIEN